MYNICQWVQFSPPQALLQADKSKSCLFTKPGILLVGNKRMSDRPQIDSIQTDGHSYTITISVCTYTLSISLYLYRASLQCCFQLVSNFSYAWSRESSIGKIWNQALRPLTWNFANINCSDLNFQADLAECLPT